MSTKEIPYSKMHELLGVVGFEEVPTKREHRLYEHKESEAIVILPGEVQTIRQIHLVALRKIVVEFGIMENEEFEQLVRDVFEPKQNDAILYKGKSANLAVVVKTRRGITVITSENVKVIAPPSVAKRARVYKESLAKEH